MTEEEFQQAETYWERQAAGQKQMARDEIFAWASEFLAAHKVLALATAAADFVRCTPLEYVWQAGALWIFTEGGRKFRALRENQHVAAAVFDTQVALGKIQSLQLAGTAELVEPFSEEYERAAKYRHVPLETLKKFQEPMWLLKIVPTEMTCLNFAFKKEGFASRQIWRAEA